MHISVSDSGALPPCPTPFNMAAHVLAAGAGEPEKSALELLGPDGVETRWSFGDLTRAVGGVGAGLLARGLAPGDRVLMRLGNSPEFPVVFLAAISVGLIPVPTAAALTAAEITKMAATISPRLIVAAPGIALPEGARDILWAGDVAVLHALPPAPVEMGDPDRPAYIVFTSGTSGQARAVTHAHRAIWARRAMHEGWYGLRETDRVFHAGAFNWTYTLGTGLMDPWSVGASALIARAGMAPRDLPALLARHGATLFAAAPGVYRQMLRAEFPPLPALRHGVSAGEKLPEATRAAWEARTGTPIHEAFGMSECSTFISGAPRRPAPPGTLGYPQDGRRVAILDADGAPTPRGTGGTLAVHRGDPGLMLGYWGAEAATARRMSGDWFLTGDQALMEADGAIRYLGRGDDIMNAGGYRVSPLEVEAALCAHPGIEEAAAAELQIKSDASIIAAFYTGPAPLEEAELKAHCAARLAPYKCPRLFVHRTALPRNQNGKLQRAALAAQYEAET